jgi:hypothetical protein
MAVNNSQNGAFGTELSAVMNGTNVQIGVLPVNPVIMIFDNQGASPVAIYVDGVVGMTFFGNGASGTFSISYTYAINQ